MSDGDHNFYAELEEERDESQDHRYLFTVRQRFGEKPNVDCFYELKVPSGLTGDQAKIMKVLDARFCKEAITEDTSALHGMELRLRFNSDMYHHVCLVRAKIEITAEDMDMIIESKHDLGELADFLKESALNE